MYRDTCIELYEKQLKLLIPDIDEYTLQSMRLAFFTGFNMGMAAFEEKWIQEQALKSLQVIVDIDESVC